MCPIILGETDQRETVSYSQRVRGRRRRSECALAVHGGHIHVVARLQSDELDLIRSNISHALCRRSNDEGVWRENLVRRDQGAGADYAVPADQRAVHDDRAHPDEALVLDGACVKQSFVPHCDTIAHLGAADAREMDYRAVLDVRILADLTKHTEEFKTPSAGIRITPTSMVLMSARSTQP